MCRAFGNTTTPYHIVGTPYPDNKQPMFRKFSEQLSAAFSTGSSRSDAAKVQQLVALGFSESQATQALAQSAGDVERAAELLLNQQVSTMTTRTSQEVIDLTEEDDMIRQAMEASLQVPPASTATSAPSHTPNRATNAPQRTAAMNKAAQAALERSNTKSPPSSGNSSLSEHHPTVKVIPKLSEKPTEEQILRTTDRLKSSHAAVDTLLKAITAVQKNPENPKFRTIDTTTPGYQRSIAPAPGAADFLRAMQYRPAGNNKLVLDSFMVDPALLYLGISALEQTKLTPEYRQAKAEALFVKELFTIRAAADTSEQEAIKRAAHLSKCPMEPPIGRSTNLQVTMGQEVLRRRFEGDDTLLDVMHWLGAHGSPIFEHLQQGSWVLLDVHRNVVLNAKQRANDTLQYLECWPSGRLQLTTQALIDLREES